MWKEIVKNRAWIEIENWLYQKTQNYLPLNIISTKASLVVQIVKNLPAMQETQVWSLTREDPLEKEMASTPVVLPGEFQGQRSLAGIYSLWGCKQSEMTEWITHKELYGKKVM